MRLTIVPEYKTVGVDGIFMSNMDMSKIDPSIHAIQWNGEYGEIEYKAKLIDGKLVKPENTMFYSIAEYEYLLPSWQEKKDKDDAERAAFLQSLDIPLPMAPGN